MLEQRSFGDAGATVLVEEFMEGEELSVFALTDGEWLVPLPPAQDHKRLLDGDRGPNTGGMGAYAPVSRRLSPRCRAEHCSDTIVRPTLAAMRARGTPFTGLLYAGLMLTRDGPKVVEFNCRFGDPETQAVLPMLARSRLVARADARHRARRRACTATTSFEPPSAAAVTTVLASAGYPEAAAHRRRHHDPTHCRTDVLVFHAGTKRRARRRAGHRTADACSRSPAARRPFEEAQRQQPRVRLTSGTSTASSSAPTSAGASCARRRRAMPELPETETIARDLDREVSGARITDGARHQAPTCCARSSPRELAQRVARRDDRRAAGGAPSSSCSISRPATGSSCSRASPARCSSTPAIFPSASAHYSTVELALDDGRSLHYRDIRRLGTRHADASRPLRRATPRRSASSHLTPRSPPSIYRYFFGALDRRSKRC